MSKLEQKAPPITTSSGVQALINRLQSEGVAAGQEQSQRIIEDAEKRAEWLLQQAKDEAEQILKKAHSDVAFAEKSGKDALAMAVRDSQIYLQNYLLGAFAEQIQKLVSGAMQQQDLLEKMILEIARQARPADKAVKILFSEAESNKATDQLDKQAADALVSFVAEHAKSMLQEGVDIDLGNEPAAAMRLQIKDEKAEVELSANTVTALILKHIQPRFKTLLQGLMN